MHRVTRRDFMGRIGGAAALAGVHSLSANAADASHLNENQPLFSFVIDSDPHTDIDREDEHTGREKLRDVLIKVQELDPKPDFMLILGDVHGEALKEVIAETDFRLPIHVVFGNADDRASRKMLREMFPEDFGENDFYSFTHKGCKFIGICDAIPGDHVGHLSSEFYRGLHQCRWLEEQLAEGRESCDQTFAFAHIPLHPDGKEANYYLAVNDQRFLKGLVLEHEPRALFFGHLHRKEEFTIGKTDVISVQGSNWTNTLVPPPYDPIGFNVARVYENGLKLDFIPIEPR